MPEQAGETRVVLVKPGDVLLIGNVGDLAAVGGEDGFLALSAALDKLGLPTILFASDVDTSVLTRENIAALTPGAAGA